MNRVHFSSKSLTWETPKWLFSLLDDEFGFQLDAAASKLNHLCEDFLTRKDNALEVNWKKRATVVWLNPPFGRRLQAFCQKAAREARRGVTVVILTPARTDTAWCWKYLRKGEIRLLPGRLKFGQKGVQAECGAPFPVMVTILGPGTEKPGTVSWWDIRDPNHRVRKAKKK